MLLRVIFPTQYPGIGNCPADFCCLCRNVEFVQIKRQGKGRKLSGFIWAKLTGACLYQTKEPFCCLAGVVKQPLICKQFRVQQGSQRSGLSILVAELSPVVRAGMTWQGESKAEREECLHKPKLQGV